MGLQDACSERLRGLNFGRRRGQQASIVDSISVVRTGQPCGSSIEVLYQQQRKILDIQQLNLTNTRKHEAQSYETVPSYDQQGTVVVLERNLIINSISV
ncbi:hypothetical protein SAY87_028368 [Trapa incisa]|uniref:Uncharacterized protein n=1 Tax=Trapa incisa TaxID=236973 RepID=A0AAN7KVJ3_9MYRT|nr:hypothetical protein SAY87_028368 [Trapa incisa]